jgi:hypothetical protein
MLVHLRVRRAQGMFGLIRRLLCGPQHLAVQFLIRKIGVSHASPTHRAYI